MPDSSLNARPLPAETPTPELHCPRGAMAWLVALRPRQWTKNLVVLAGVIFSGKFTASDSLLRTGAIFVIFCLLSSVGYLVNDLLDVERDRNHPVKCRRPIAAGVLHPAAVIVAAILLAFATLAGAWLLNPAALLVSLGYLILTLSYSIFWKHLAILDVMALAGAFVLRAYAGTVVLAVSISPWLFVCVLLLALFLGLGKRWHELCLLEQSAASHRPVLQQYGLPFLSQALTSISSAAMVTYAIYAINSPTASNHPKLVLTVPLVIFAVLRYLYLILHCNAGGQPEELFLTDRPLYLSVLLSAAAVMIILLVPGR